VFFNTEDAMKKYTPGPWKVVGGTVIMTDEENSSWIGNVPAANPEHDKFFEDRENARLIAAAPELLEALKNALYALTGDNDPDYDMIYAALAKAEGES
jgi:hypothetical protein